MSNRHNTYNFTLSKNVSDEGVFYAFIMICSLNTDIQNKTANSSDNAVNSNKGYLTGYVSFFNADGYLSGDSFYAIQLYLFLCLVYFVFGLFWFYKFIIYYSELNLYQKLISVIIPVIIFECLINLQIYTEINNTGTGGKIFIVLSILSSLVKNTLIRIILYGLSIGFTIYTYFDKFNCFRKSVSKKKIIKFATLISGYIVFETTFHILYELFKSK